MSKVIAILLLGAASLACPLRTDPVIPDGGTNRADAAQDRGGSGGAAPGTGGSASGTGGSSAPGTGGSAPGTGGSAPGTGGSAPGTGGTAPGTGGGAPGTGGSAPGTGGRNGTGGVPGSGGAGTGGADGGVDAPVDALLGPGAACTNRNQCASGNCVNNACCSTPTCPTCQACNVNTTGTCANRPSGATDTGCVAASCQASTCNGAGACQRAADGSGCGAAGQNFFCNNGVCGSCVPGQSCQPANPCKNGMTSCTTGLMACMETTNKNQNTMCGPGASCTGVTKTNAAICNATGTCGVSTTSCPNGCNAAGNDCLTCGAGLAACNGVCCQAGQGCCGGACVNIQTDPQRCGASCTACPSMAPRCLAGACVRCINNQDCSGSTPSCDPTTHTCVCRIPRAGNLVNNPGFDDSRGVTGWMQFDAVTHSTDDADGCADSGSARATTFSNGSPFQCIPVAGSTTYYAGAKFKTAGSPSWCEVFFYSDATCRDFLDTTMSLPVASGSVTGWQSMSGTITTAFSVRAVALQCYLENSNMDQVYWNATAGGF